MFDAKPEWAIEEVKRTDQVKHQVTKLMNQITPNIT